MELSSTHSDSSAAANAPGATRDFVAFTVANQLFGIPVLQVQDILIPQQIAAVPLAPPEVRGLLNLRGRIVPVIDMRTRLGLTQDTLPPATSQMCVTVERGNELYTLLVDVVGDVVSLSPDLFEQNSRTIDPSWRDFVSGVFRTDGKLMVVLDIERLLDIHQPAHN